MPDNMEHVVEHIDKYVADLNEDIESLKQHVSADRFSEEVLDGMTRNIQNRVKNLLITCAIVYKLKEGEMKLEWQEDTKRMAALKFEKEQEIINHLSPNS